MCFRIRGRYWARGSRRGSAPRDLQRRGSNDWRRWWRLRRSSPACRVGSWQRRFAASSALAVRLLPFRGAGARLAALVADEVCPGGDSVEADALWMVPAARTVPAAQKLAAQGAPHSASAWSEAGKKSRRRRRTHHSRHHRHSSMYKSGLYGCGAGDRRKQLTRSTAATRSRSGRHRGGAARGRARHLADAVRRDSVGLELTRPSLRAGGERKRVRVARGIRRRRIRIARAPVDNPASAPCMRSA